MKIKIDKEENFKKHQWDWKYSFVILIYVLFVIILFLLYVFYKICS